MTLAGIDVSRHQGYVDWTAVARAKDFAFVKATDGIRYPYIGWFRENWPRLRATEGIVAGAYHWLTGADPAAQARYFVAELGNVDGVLCALDVERDTDGSFPTIDKVRGFATEFARLTDGHPLVIYSGSWFWKSYLGNPRGVDLGPLWHAEYETSQAEIDDGPELEGYGGWPYATFWQYTSSGSCPGVAGAVDLDVFYGRPEDLHALTQGDDMGLTRDETKAAVREVLEEEWGTPGSKVRVGAEDVLERIGNPGTQAGKAFAAGVHAALDDVLDPFAEAVAGKLAGSADTAVVKAAVREAFAEVTSRFEFVPGT